MPPTTADRQVVFDEELRLNGLMHLVASPAMATPTVSVSAILLAKSMRLSGKRAGWAVALTSLLISLGGLGFVRLVPKVLCSPSEMVSTALLRHCSLLR